MKRFLILIALAATALTANAQKLIMRGDDIGSSHAANIGIIESYTNGIMRSAEIMIVCPWVPEAVEMLKEHPGLDVGLHIVFTSEWDNMKWRPLTDFTTAVDEYGYFVPSTYPNPNKPGFAIMERDIDLAEAEKELRAQIELALALLPDITHCTSHMGASNVSKEMLDMTIRVCDEYGVPFMDAQTEKYGFERLQGVPWGLSPEERLEAFTHALANLEKGKTYMYLEHPAVDSPEMRAIHHVGYEDVAIDRQAVLDMFTSPEIKCIIEQKGIELISYGDLLKR